MRQGLSLLTLPMINISLANFCKTHTKVYKTCCSFWELPCIKKQSIPGSILSMWLKQSSLYTQRIKASCLFRQGPEWLMPVKVWSTSPIIHAYIKAFCFVCHSAPHLTCKYKQGEKKPTKKQNLCAFKKLLQKSLHNLNKIFYSPYGWTITCSKPVSAKI